MINEEKAKTIWYKLESMSMTKILTNKLYVNKQLYMEENTNLLKQLNKINILNKHLLNFGVKLKQEDKAKLLLALLPNKVLSH
jgi:hypothetical protein